jgi:hypothetical protein
MLKQYKNHVSFLMTLLPLGYYLLHIFTWENLNNAFFCVTESLLGPLPAYGAPEPSLATFTIVTTNNGIFTIMILIGGSFIIENHLKKGKTHINQFVLWVVLLPHYLTLKNILNI